MIDKYLVSVGSAEATDAVTPDIPLELSFSKRQALDELFVTEDEFDTILDRLEFKKNIILQGPPGVGKTFFARLLAQAFIGSTSSYEYEAFNFTLRMHTRILSKAIDRMAKAGSNGKTEFFCASASVLKLIL